MTRKLLNTLVGAAALGAACTPPATATTNVVDPVPAATLLLPYFEVDTANASGVNTVLRINNVYPGAKLVMVTLWTDLAVPTYTFPVYLTGFDAEEIDLRMVFNGVIPTTASAGQDPSDRISPKGDFSQDINYASCSVQVPPDSFNTLPLARASAAVRAELKALHTGAAGPTSGKCAGASHGDQIARGYVTVDHVTSCTDSFPGTGYAWETNLGTNNSYPDPMDPATRRSYGTNGIAGDFAIFSRSGGTLAAGRLAGFEVDANAQSGDYTFYASRNGSNGADKREGSATTWAHRIPSSSATDTTVIYWRDPKQAMSPFSCGATPAPFPLTQTEVIWFDAQETPTIISGSNLFPWAAGRVSLSSLITPEAGWLYSNLNHSGTAQSYMEVTLSGSGWQTQVPGLQVDNVSDPITTSIAN